MRPGGGVSAGGRIVAAVRPDLPTVDILDTSDGSVIRVEWDEDPPSMTEELRRELEERLASYGRSLDPEARQASNSSPVPVTGLGFVDRSNRVWVSRYTPDHRRYRRYRVFDSTGHWLGWVDMPDRVQILDTGEDRILAIVGDELDVEPVAVFPFAPAGP
jgi:hypothetical protein